MERKGIDSGTWIFSIFIVAFTWLMKKLAGAFVPAPYEVPEVDPDDFLASKKFSSYTSDTDIINISEAYELYCVKEPLRYQDDPRVPGIVDKYHKLLSGEILDAEGKHMPSYQVDGSLNPEYAKYINGQYKAFSTSERLSAVPWLVKEYNRVQGLGEERDIRSEYKDILIGLGIPDSLIPVFLTDQRINSFEPEDWREFVRIVFEYLKVYDAMDVYAFLRLFSEKEILFDSNKMDQFATYTKYGAPVFIITEIIRDRVSVEQGTEITRLVEEESYDWIDAIREVLSDTIEQARIDELHHKYGVE